GRGLLAEQLQVEAGWEAAVEAVLADDLQAIALDDLSSLDATLAEFEQGSLRLLQRGAPGQASPGSLLDKVDSPLDLRPWLAAIRPVDSVAEALAQRAELAPLKSEFIQIRYAKAANVITLFEAGSEQGGSLVSERGSVVVDDRANSIIVTDTAAKLDEIRALIENVDIPIRQVMIEARIVIASSDVDEQLGIKWGGGYFESDADSVLSVARNMETTTAINQAVLGGTAVTPPTAPFVDLGIASATSGFAVGFTSDDLFLSAELAALEAAGEGEVVSQPKVITGDKQQATIKSGTVIPYQEGAASGATTTQFKEAVLKLDVTPNITPDDRILRDLVVNKDSVGELVPSANGGVVHSIDTTELTTQVLVGNGETVVLGGVFKNEETIQIQKVPVLGDMPGVGSLFKSTVSTIKKVETLIFITPRILSEVLLD
ncbi:MAG: type IV pilus secretin PilQ, partial [Pseudomonadota bacterium]|nr:type IV pilus secretin PilQ [Pseudomonadota bacterium]